MTPIFAVMGTKKADLSWVRSALWEGKLRVKHDLRFLARTSVYWGNNERARLHRLTAEVVPQRFAPVQPASERKKKSPE